VGHFLSAINFLISSVIFFIPSGTSAAVSAQVVVCTLVTYLGLFRSFRGSCSDKRVLEMTAVPIIGRYSLDYFGAIPIIDASV
jgi:hypothetical protein